MQPVGFVVGHGFPVMSLAALAAFEFANASVETPFYGVGVLSEAGGRVTSSLSLAIETKRFGSSMFDTVIVAGTMDVALRDQPAV
jgi:transcriptional regulator GlxA family with amidase domain